MIQLIAATIGGAIIGAIVGFFACTAIAIDMIEDATIEAKERADQADAAFEVERDINDAISVGFTELCSRIDHALAQETAGANATVKRICAILRGDA